ncbi:MAG: beta-N-acetylhexosaminidase [Acidobacteriota bacterium]
MTTAIADRVGRMLIVGIPGPELDRASRDLLTAVRPGGVILFARNCVQAAQVAAITREVRNLYEPSPFLAVDEEGGRVTRLGAFLPPRPPAADLGRLPMAAACQWFGALTGRALRSLGFHIDFAPVVDLSLPAAGDGIGDRAFSDDPAAVAARAGGFLRGLAEAGLAGCLKHFPGHGGASADSHVELPTVQRGDDGRQRALEPYRRLRDQAAMTMVAHVVDPGLAGPQRLPSSLDRQVVTGLLRETIEFAGVSVADDLEMGAVAARGDFGDLAASAIAAGNDQILVCESPERVHAAWEGLRQAAGTPTLPAAQVEASLGRIDALAACPAVARAAEPFQPEELAVVIEEMKDLGGEVERALQRQR